MPYYDSISKTTDANGWTVYNYGTWKEYRKRVTFSQAFTAGSLVAVSLSSTNLPSGMSTLSTNFLSATIVPSGFAGDFKAYPEMSSSSASLSVTANPQVTRTYSGLIDFQIVTA